MGRPVRLLRAGAWVVALAAVVWWASRQREPRIPTDRRGLFELALAIGLYAVATVGRGERWFQILRRRGVTIGRRDANGLTAVGYMGNNILPARAGDVLRVWLLSARGAVGMPEGLGSAIAERLLDALALVAVFGVATAVLLPNHRLLSARSVLLGIAVIAGILLVAASVGWVILRRRGGWPRLRRIIVPLLASTRDLAGGLGLCLLGLSVVIWVLEASVYVLCGRALGLPFGAAQAAYVMAFANLAGLLPAGPGYVGTYDAAVLLSARGLGALAGAGVSYLLLVRFVLFVPITVVGLILLATRYGGLSLLPRRRLPVSQ